MASAAVEAGPVPARQVDLNVSVFFPVVLGVVRPPPLPEGTAGPVEPDRIVLLNPLTQGMLVLRAEGDTDEVFSRLVRDLAVAASMGDGVKGPPPASKASIEAMKEVAEVGAEEECPVCLEELRRRRQQQREEEEEEGEGEEKPGVEAAAAAKEMPCGHRFHKGCIEKWLGMHGSCPVCRYLMPPEEVEESGNKGGEERHQAGEVWVSFGFDGSGRDAEGGDSTANVDEREPTMEQRREFNQED